jgi:hypothetical protein
VARLSSPYGPKRHRVLANLLEPGVEGCRGVVVSTLDGRTSLRYSLTRIRAMRRFGWVRSLTLLGTTNMVMLLAFDPCEGPYGRTEESLRALGDERVEERAIVRVYILGPAALATSSQALCVFLASMATWRRATLQELRTIY